MDGLTDEERILAWKAIWHPSFAGMAIVEKDGTFRSVNNKFCELLQVTQAELIGQRFQDITPPEIRKIDDQNAQLLADGIIDFYILPRTYNFGGGRVKSVILLVTRAPNAPDGGEFRFFVSRIMLSGEGSSSPKDIAEDLGAGQILLSRLKEDKKLLAAIVSLIVGLGLLFAGIGQAIAEIVKGFVR